MKEEPHLDIEDWHPLAILQQIELKTETDNLGYTKFLVDTYGPGYWEVIVKGYGNESFRSLAGMFEWMLEHRNLMKSGETHIYWREGMNEPGASEVLQMRHE